MRKTDKFDYEKELRISGAIELYGLSRRTAKILVRDVFEDLIPYYVAKSQRGEK